MNEIEKTLSSIMEKVMNEDNEQHKMMLKTQVLKLANRLSSMDAVAVKDTLEVLESMNWRNYLTESEAKVIIAQMNPKPAWPTYEVWKNRMDDVDYEYSEKDLYNGCALFVAMNKVYSDHAQSICLIAGKKLEDIPEEEMFGFVYLLALDLLKDADNHFCIRRYFQL